MTGLSGSPRGGGHSGYDPLKANHREPTHILPPNRSRAPWTRLGPSWGRFSITFTFQGPAGSIRALQNDPGSRGMDQGPQYKAGPRGTDQGPERRIRGPAVEIRAHGRRKRGDASAVEKSAGDIPEKFWYFGIIFLDTNDNFTLTNIFKLKWPKSEEKLNFGGRWSWVPRNPFPPTKLHGDSLAGPAERIRAPRDKAGPREMDENPAGRSSAPQHARAYPPLGKVGNFPTRILTLEIYSGISPVKIWFRP